MKQVIQDMRNGVTQVVDVPVPKIQPGMGLVKTAISVVSVGTERQVVEFGQKSLIAKARSRPDLVRQVMSKTKQEGILPTLEKAFTRLEQPIALGYASSGTLIELGEGMTGFQAGQRVACAGGGYAVHAEYTLVPKNLICNIPDDVDFESAAFTTLGAISMHGFRLSGAGLGERVAIIGLGILGMLCAQIARSAGCLVLGIDLDKTRVELAEKMGLNAIPRINAESVCNSFTAEVGFDAVIICADTTSADPVELAGEISRDKAQVVAVGAVGQQLPRKIYYEKELAFINSRSYGPGRYDQSYEEGGYDYPIGFVRWTEQRNMSAFLDLLAKGIVHVKPLVTHHFSIEQAPQAYELISKKPKKNYLGIVMQYSAEEKTELDRVVPTHVQSHARDFTVEKHESQYQSGQIRLGILGAGNFANAVLLPVLKKIPAIQLVAIASASGLTAGKIAQKYQFQYTSTDEEKIITDANINAIAIVTRHHLHANQVISALLKGKDVFCEKPLAILPDELADIEELLDHIQEQNGQSDDWKPLLTLGFNRRFSPMLRQVVNFYNRRVEPLYIHYRVNAGYLPLTHWTQDIQQGGGRIIGESCHFIDVLTCLVGSIPINVTTFGLNNSSKYLEDNVVMNFSFLDGSIGTLTYLANGSKSYPKERMEVFGDGRIAILDDFRTLSLISDDKKKIIRSRFKQDKGHLEVWKAFVDAALNTRLPPIPYEQIIGVTRASFAALESLRKQQRINI